jgi:hypothetical protein
MRWMLIVRTLWLKVVTNIMKLRTTRLVVMGSPIVVVMGGLIVVVMGGPIVIWTTGVVLAVRVTHVGVSGRWKQTKIYTVLTVTTFRNSVREFPRGVMKRVPVRKVNPG